MNGRNSHICGTTATTASLPSVGWMTSRFSGNSRFQLDRVAAPFVPLRVPRPGFYHEVINSEVAVYGGSSAGNLGGAAPVESPSRGKSWSLSLTASRNLILDRVFQFFVKSPRSNAGQCALRFPRKERAEACPRQEIC
jgi:Alpha amylase, C-terminal all-beta domain